MLNKDDMVEGEELVLVALICDTLTSTIADTWNLEGEDDDVDTGTSNFEDGPYSEERKQKVWKLCRHWMQHCQQKHTQCGPFPTRQKGYCPTRLVDIRDLSIRLIEKDDFPVGGQLPLYAPLSYCWGANMPESAKTLITTLASHKKAIDIEMLPQTFKDAIEITRKLGIFYLWIDSLCIIQDSKEDWEVEAAAMGEVYSHGVVTITAAASDNCDGGMLRAHGTEINDIDSLFTSLGQWTAIFDSSNAILKRGWTLQERELSPKAIYFTSREVLWECRETRYRYHDRFAPRSRTLTLSRCLDFPMNLGSIQLPENTLKAFHLDERLNKWQKTIEDYSRRSFSNIDDRMPALSGFASIFASMIDDRYVAGLWQKRLPQDLLWRAHGQTVNSSFDGVIPEYRTSLSTRIQRPDTYLPSWSWFSVSVSVRWDSHWKPLLDDVGFTERAEVIEINLVPIFPLNPFGYLKSGMMRVKGKLKNSDVGPFADPGQAGQAELSLLRAIHLHWDGVAVSDSIYLFNIEGRNVSISYDQKSTTFHTQGLILVKRESEETFERVGMYKGNVSPLDWSHQWKTCEIVIV